MHARGSDVVRVRTRPETLPTVSIREVNQLIRPILALSQGGRCFIFFIVFHALRGTLVFRVVHGVADGDFSAADLCTTTTYLFRGEEQEGP